MQRSGRGRTGQLGGFSQAPRCTKYVFATPLLEFRILIRSKNSSDQGHPLAVTQPETFQLGHKTKRKKLRKKPLEAGLVGTFLFEETGCSWQKDIAPHRTSQLIATERSSSGSSSRCCKIICLTLRLQGRQCPVSK